MCLYDPTVPTRAFITCISCIRSTHTTSHLTCTCTSNVFYYVEYDCKYLIDVEEDVEKADRKKDEIGQKSAVFMILRRFATGKS